MLAVLIVLLGLLCALSNAQIAAKDFIPTYQCSFCLASVDAYFEQNSNSLFNSCRSLFPENICRDLNLDGAEVINALQSVKNSDSRAVCRLMNRCPSESSTTAALSAPVRSANGVDIRVSKAMGSRGYNKVRISAIANSTVSSTLFDYHSQFKYRWTDKYLSTGVVTVTPGQTNSFTIAGNKVDIFIPKEGDGVRGVIIADPCFQSDWIVCLYQNKFSPLTRIPELLNAVFAHEDTHYWQILGDNFYDQQGAASSTFFNTLSAQTKSKVFASVPGNHDFWVNASPKLWVPKDQQGNGFMQFYGQDVIASVAHAPEPFDFANDPDGANKGSENLPPAENFFFYNKLGNVAFVGYSGAHSFASMKNHFEEACQWAQTVNPATLFLLGHWNSDGDGCDSDVTVPAVYQSILALPACAPFQGKTRYFMGHKHCNIITEENVGFMVGAQAMSDATSCGGAFGLPIVDTTDNRFRVYYFPFATAGVFDDNAYNTVLQCIQQHGVSQCYHLAVEWANVPL